MSSITKEWEQWQDDVLEIDPCDKGGEKDMKIEDFDASRGEDASREEIIYLINVVISKKELGDYYERDMINALNFLSIKVRQHREAQDKYEAEEEGYPNIFDPDCKYGIIYGYSTLEEVNFDFKELEKCKECLAINSKKLERATLNTIYRIGESLKRLILRITFLKEKGNDPSEVWDWKEKWNSIGIDIIL